MALDDLPGTLQTPTRGEIETKFRRDYGIVSPESDTSDGSQPDVLAKTVAITLLPIYSDAVLITNAINEDNATGKRLDRVGARYGVPRPLAVGASGYVAVSVSNGTIQAGDEIKNRQTGKRYVAAETRSLIDLGTIRIAGLDTGPATNLDAGVTLQWSAPRPGIGQTATVAAGGLTGGADDADDAAYLAVIREARRNPANADNDAAIRKIVMSTPGLAVQAVFTYPCIFGPGTSAFTFTLAVPAGSKPAARIPSAGQVAAALAYLVGQLPGDDSYFAISLIASTTGIALQMTWDPSAIGWADSTPWPPYKARALPAGNAGQVVVVTQISTSSFVLGTDNGDYTGAVQPQVGQSIGFWDAAAAGPTFRMKRITVISGPGPWTITSDRVIGDQSLAPVVGMRASPWADSLLDLGKPLLEYFNGMGPGEMFTAAALSNDGRRQRRNPRPPKQYPQAIANDMIVPILALPSVQSAALLEGLGAMPAIGTPGLNVLMITAGDLAAFP